ncbi:uncharacterized protein LOC120348676 [Styela clava]
MRISVQNNFGRVGLSASLAVTILVFFYVIKETESARGNYVKKLIDDLFLTYKKDIRPVNNTEEAVSVNFTVFLFQILELDERNQILTAYLWLRQEWVDANLYWNPKKYDGLEKIRLPSKRIWLPDIVLYNNADGTFPKNLQTNVVLTSKGEIRWDQPAITKTSCKMDVSFFPFDSQSCIFTFGSWTFYLEHLDVIPTQAQGNRDDFVTNVEWQVVDMPVKRVVEEYSCCPDPYPIVEITLGLKRKSTFYIFNLLLPCIFISILLPLTFYLPAESGEKVSLGITTLLAMTVFQLLVAESMPPSEAVPLIGKYYITTMALMSFSTATTIFVQNIHFCGPNPPPVPGWMRKYILHYLAGLLNIKIHHKPPEPLSDACESNESLAGQKSKFYHKSSTKREKVEPKPITHDEVTPFLTNSRQNRHILSPEGAQEKDGVYRKPNGNCLRYTQSVRSFATTPIISAPEPIAHELTKESEVNISQYQFQKLKADARSSWPTLSPECIATQPPIDPPDYFGTTLPRPPSISTTYQRRPSLKRITSQQVMRSTMRSSTSTPIPSNPLESASLRRQNLVQMNAMTKTADFSDDTEVSVVTPACSESPKRHSSPGQYHRKHSSPHEITDSEKTWKGQNPILGLGFNSYTINHPPRDRERRKSYEFPPHSEYGSSTKICRNGSKRKPSREISSQLSRRRSRSHSPGNPLESESKQAVVLQNHSTQTPSSDESSYFHDDAKLRKSISKNISTIADHFRRQRKVVDNMDEWKNVSRVCDRALMWVFVMIQVLFSTLILCKIL